MAEFHDQMRALSARLIDKFGSGGTATFTRTVKSGFDPIESTETITTTMHTAAVVVPPATDQSREDQRTLGWDVRFKCGLFGDGFVPQPGDMVTLPGREAMTVIAPVEMAAPDGEAIVYTVRARKGS